MPRTGGVQTVAADSETLNPTTEPHPEFNRPHCILESPDSTGQMIEFDQCCDGSGEATGQLLPNGYLIVNESKTRI